MLVHCICTHQAAADFAVEAANGSQQLADIADHTRRHFWRQVEVAGWKDSQ